MYYFKININLQVLIAMKKKKQARSINRPAAPIVYIRDVENLPEAYFPHTRAHIFSNLAWLEPEILSFHCRNLGMFL